MILVFLTCSIRAFCYNGYMIRHALNWRLSLQFQRLLSAILLKISDILSWFSDLLKDIFQSYIRIFLYDEIVDIKHKET